MKRIFAAIARLASALRSSVSFVWDKCAKTGAWTLRQVASLGGGSAVPDYAGAEDLMPDNDNGTARDEHIKKLLKDSQALVDSIDIPKLKGGDGYDVIQRVCRTLSAGDEPQLEDARQLSPLQLAWINTMTPEMRFVIGNERRDAVIAHMRGGKGIHGVLRSDVESINQWRHSLAVEMERNRLEFIDGPAPDPEDVPALHRVV